MAIFGSKKSWQGQEATGLPPPPAGGAPSGLRSTRISMATPAWHEPRVISTCLVNSLIVHFLDVEMDSANWNLRGHSVDVLYPTGLRGGTRIAIVLFFQS